MKNKNDKIYVGVIPDIFGYGINVIGHTEAQALEALELAYWDWKEGAFGEYERKQFEDEYDEVLHKDGTPYTHFERVMDYHGGRVTAVKIGDYYFDNFGE